MTIISKDIFFILASYFVSLESKLQNVIDLNDILSSSYMPGSFLMLDQSPKSYQGINKTISNIGQKGTALDGSINKALATMKFHRSMMNQYMCRSYVADQILSDINHTKFQKRMGQAPPLNMQDKPGFAEKIKNNLLFDEGSTAYQNWLSKSTTLEDIYKNHNKLVNRRDGEEYLENVASEDEEKNEDISENYNAHSGGYKFKQNAGKAVGIGHRGHNNGLYYFGGGNYPDLGLSEHLSFGNSDHHDDHRLYESGHTFEHEPIYGYPTKHSVHYSGGGYDKTQELADIFEIALTALAYLSFGMFVVHLIMSISAVKNNATTTMPSMMMPMSMSPTATATGGGNDDSGGGNAPGTPSTGGGNTGTGSGGMPGTGGGTSTGGGTTSTGGGTTSTGGGTTSMGSDTTSTGSGSMGGDTTSMGGGTTSTGSGGMVGDTTSMGGGSTSPGSDSMGGDTTSMGGGATSMGGSTGSGATSVGGGTTSTGSDSMGGDTTSMGGGTTSMGGSTGSGATSVGGGTTSTGSGNMPGGATSTGGDTMSVDTTNMEGDTGDAATTGTGPGAGSTSMGGSTSGGGTGMDGTASGTATGTGDGADTFKFRLKREVPKLNSPNNVALNEMAKRILSSIDAALVAYSDDGQCLKKSLCSSTKYSRSLSGLNKVIIPVWSLGMSWLSGNLTREASSKARIDGLKATVLGLGMANCETIYQKCDLKKAKHLATQKK